MPDAQPGAAEVRSLLHGAGLAAHAVEPVGGGQVSWTYFADGQWVVQIPRFDRAARTMRVQAELMPLVTAAVPFAVPVPRRVATWADRPVMCYGAGIDWQRLLFYWWLNPCYELVYAGEYLDDVAVQRAVDTIRGRLSTVAELQDR